MATVMPAADSSMIRARRLLNDAVMPAKNNAVAKNNVNRTYPSALSPALEGRLGTSQDHSTSLPPFPAGDRGVA